MDLSNVDLNRQLIAVAVLVGLAVFAVFLAGLFFLNERRRRRIRERVFDAERRSDFDELPEASLVRDTTLSTVPALDRILKRITFSNQIQALLLQSGSTMKVGTFTLLTLVLAVLGGLGAVWASGLGWTWVLGALIFGVIPWFVFYRKKEGRRKAFERQFPDALDLLVGALRSGMAFTGSLQIVAEESPDPVATEFEIVFDEHRLGLPLRDALEHMAQRIDSAELRLFVTAVMIQRDTGGNLAEILERTAAVIRDRFRILGDVKTITASVRFSGGVLMALPLFMAALLIVMSPEYMKVLITDPLGPYLIISAVSLQLIGLLFMRRIMRIKV